MLDRESWGFCPCTQGDTGKKKKKRRGDGAGRGGGAPGPGAHAHARDLHISQARRKAAARSKLESYAGSGVYRTERRLGGGTVSGLDGIANYGISDEAERRANEFVASTLQNPTSAKKIPFPLSRSLQCQDFDAWCQKTLEAVRHRP